jgi:hypothetical protein
MRTPPAGLLQGLARFCTEKYEPPSPSNITNNYTHLTNYAVNKHNPNFIFNRWVGWSCGGPQQSCINKGML